jgi:uncharacterized spore protein YtfJ
MKYRIQNDEGIWLDEKAFTGIFLEMLKNQLAPYIDMVGGAGTIIVDSTLTEALSIEDEFGVKLLSFNSITGEVLDKDGNVIVGGIVTSPMKFAYADGSAQTNSLGYAAIARFGFDGSTAVGTPIQINAVASTSATSYSIRIVDITNGSLVIAELTGQTNATPTIIDLGTITNIDAGAAIWEVQMLKAGGGGFTALDSLSIKF